MERCSIKGTNVHVYNERMETFEVCATAVRACFLFLPAMLTDLIHAGFVSNLQVSAKLCPEMASITYTFVYVCRQSSETLSGEAERIFAVIRGTLLQAAPRLPLVEIGGLNLLVHSGDGRRLSWKVLSDSKHYQIVTTCQIDGISRVSHRDSCRVGYK